MHRIVKAHLSNFVKSYGYELEDEADQFEIFAAHCVIASRFTSTFEMEDVKTGPGEDGIDGVAILIDEAVCASEEDAEFIFSAERRNHDVDVVFIQAKRSETFDLGDFLKFKESILRFVNQDPYIVQNEVLANARKVFDVVVSQVPKIRNGKPSLTVRYVNTGLYREPGALQIAVKDFETQLNELGLFYAIDIKFIDRDELTKLWVETYSGIDASLSISSSAALPNIADIDEAYLVVVSAKEFVKNLLTTSDGSLRTQVFEENVRAFLGDDNLVNKSIAETLQSTAKSRFPVLNNGITIVSPDVRVQGSTIHLKNFQIVNGCQTSNVLYENQDSLESVMVNLKIVETKNEDVFSELVKATNSQSKVDDTQFLSLLPISKRVEQFFNSFSDQDKLFFERRDRQYAGLDIQTIKIYSLHNAAKCVAAMYCERPDLASRYPKRVYDELGEQIFADDSKEILFYSACYAMYKLTVLFANGEIPQELKKLKWHMLPLLRLMIVGDKKFHFSSKDAQKSAQAILDALTSDEALKKFAKKLTLVCKKFKDETSDRLKRQAILSEMIESAK